MATTSGQDCSLPALILSLLTIMVLSLSLGTDVIVDKKCLALNARAGSSSHTIYNIITTIALTPRPSCFGSDWLTNSDNVA